MTSSRAIRELLTALDACFGGRAPWEELVDLDVASRMAGRFKLDVSFSFEKEPWARFSVNDKGEPEAFRARVEKHAGRLGIANSLLNQLFALSPAGEVQTTLGVKWRAGDANPARVSVYLEELADSERGAQIRHDVLALCQVETPALSNGARPNAVCIDFARGVLAGSKTYDVFLEMPGDEAPPMPTLLESVRNELPFHPSLRTRRTMLAKRYDAVGQLVGHKLFWMTELRERALVPMAWAHFEHLRQQFGQHANAQVSGALADLRARFGTEDAFLFPDLVGINLDAAGATNLVVHVSVR